MTWVPMAPVLPGKPNHYSPGQATMQLDASLDAKPVQVVFDSGTTYTYLPRRLLTPLVHALSRSVSKSLKVVKDPALTSCWSRSGGFKSLDDLKKEFKSVMSLKFENGATMMLPPENYLVIIPNTGNACLGMLEMPNSNRILIGDITLRGQLVIYDNEKGQLGWIRLPCEAKSISAISRI
ncbi:hypothetical protein PR202_ga25160 [Eleusine coracana subsp. coracana]|uniref:Peptidase A1 domain-containing protein n=1 Tax=Eleusine coracana subsp. coracana TaxID=191504 RepID=A0AAV5DAB9_ELECO|nr:hypothetical protein PR202_ga25160 [Eleusine coracana subsp. coracana]